MKRFRWKLAIITFLALLVFNGVLLLLDIWYPDNSLIIAVARVVQFPALPIAVLFPVSLSAGNDYTWDYVMCTILSSFSALVWSVLVGFFIRRSRAA
jgi:hypothetical protein